MFYPPKGLCKQYCRWSNCFYLCFNFLLGNVYWTFKKAAVIYGFWTGWKLEMFYPPKGLRKQYCRWSNCFYLCFNFVLGNLYWIFKKAAVICGFRNIKHPSLNTIQWKEISNKAHWAVLSESLRGIKHK